MAQASAQESQKPTQWRCLGCASALARMVPFCPYCGIVQPGPASADEPISVEIQGNVISFPRATEMERKPAEDESKILQTDRDADAAAPTFGIAKQACSAADKVNTAKGQAETAIETADRKAAATTNGELIGTHEVVTDRPLPLVPAQRRSGRLKWWAAVAVLVLLAIAVANLRGSGTHTAGPETVAVFVTRDDAVLRSAPTTDDTTGIRKLPRGTGLVGVWQGGVNGSRWLKVAEGPFVGDFVWDKNLSTDKPPVIVQYINGSMSTTQAAAVLLKPNYSSTTLQQIGAGLSVFVVGATSDGWLEIALRRGGVGYLPRSAFE